MLKLILVFILVGCSTGCMSHSVKRNHATHYHVSMDNIASFEKTANGDYSFNVEGNIYKAGFGLHQLFISEREISQSLSAQDTLYIYAGPEDFHFLDESNGQVPEFSSPDNLAHPEIQHKSQLYLTGWDNGMDVKIIFSGLSEYSSTGKLLRPFAVVADVVTFPVQFVYWIFYPPT